MKRPRRNHAAPFKAKVALVALRGDRTLAEIAQQYDVHPKQIVPWKTQLQEGAMDLFVTAADRKNMEPRLRRIKGFQALPLLRQALLTAAQGGEETAAIQAA